MRGAARPALLDAAISSSSRELRPRAQAAGPQMATTTGIVKAIAVVAKLPAVRGNTDKVKDVGMGMCSSMCEKISATPSWPSDAAVQLSEAAGCRYTAPVRLHERPRVCARARTLGQVGRGRGGGGRGLRTAHPVQADHMRSRAGPRADGRVQGRGARATRRRLRVRRWHRAPLREKVSLNS